MRIQGLRRATADETGATLLETVVAMTLLTMFMAIFTTATVMMTRTTSRVQSTSESLDLSNGAFLQLDRTLRYATAFSGPQITGGAWNVELSSTEQLANGTARDRCTQLAVIDGQLKQRRWTPSGATYEPGSLTTWTPLASSVMNGSVADTSPDRPFAVPAVDSSAASAHQSLTVTLVTQAGPANNRVSNRMSSVFTALNSTAVAPTSVCQQVAPGASS